MDEQTSWKPIMNTKGPQPYEDSEGNQFKPYAPQRKAPGPAKGFKKVIEQ